MSAPSSSKVDDAVEIIASGEAESFADAARQAGCSDSAVSQRWWKERRGRPNFKRETTVDRAASVEVADDGAEPTPVEKELASKVLSLQSRASAATTEARVARQRTDELEGELEKTQRELTLALDVESIPSPEWLAPRPEDEGSHRGTLLSLFSDFHVGEVVSPGELAGYNAYDPAIAEQRLKRFFERQILVARQYLAGVDYDGVVMASLGDTISGEIHDEFRQTNELSNYEAVPFAVPLITEGIGMLADEFGRVHVPCVPGNHPRDSKQPRYKKRSAHNADTLIMKLVAANFAGDDRVTFDIPDGISSDFSIYETRFRAEHGDEARGGSGIQGAMLPLALLTHRRRTQASSEGRPFDVLLVGHWHQYMSLVAKGFICNGAGKGYDEYARGKGFEPEPPQQALCVVTPQHGISMQCPLYVSKREDEGW